MLGEEPSRSFEAERSALNSGLQRHIRPLGRGSSLGGIAATVAIHVCLVTLIYFAHVKSRPSVEVPREVLVTRLVTLAKPPDKFWLPRIVQPPKPKAPPRVLKVTENPNAAPTPKEAPRPDDAELSREVQHALQRAQLLAQAEATQEAPLGSLTGSAQGTSTQDVTGDEYATVIYTAIRKNWNIPSGLITDTELAGLAAEVRLSILGDGTLAHSEMRKSSGNQYFDDSCLQAVRTTHQVPPPPANLRARFEHGTLLEFSGKDMAHQGAA